MRLYPNNSNYLISIRSLEKLEIAMEIQVSGVALIEQDELLINIVGL